MKTLIALARAACALVITGSAMAQTEFPDRDKDGIPDAMDNCVSMFNVDQTDSDNDGVGDLCDGDINKDGKVNAVDLSLLRQAFGTPGAVGNLNGDGRVNAVDLSILRGRFGKPPGPSGLPLKTDFVRNPPVARKLQVLVFDTSLPDGRNALALMDFNGAFPPGPQGEPGRVPDRIVMQTETGLVLLNDLGLFGDDKAGDGILSALIRFDQSRVDSDLKAFLTRVRQKGARSAPLFNNRELVRQVDFNVADPLPNPGEPRQLTFTLPKLGAINVVGRPFAFLPLPIPASTDPFKTLMITHNNVVQDPARTFSPCQNNGAIGGLGNVNGVWSFKTLMSNMAGATPPQQVIHDWLNQWRTGAAGGTVRHSDGVAVSFPVPARNALVNAISSLQVAPWNPGDSATLDINKLPFRLLAIVNRMDLAGGSFYGPSSPGELRFVFGLVEKQGIACVASQSELNVILEYTVPETACLGMKNLANLWIALDSLVLGSAPYNAVLQTLTDDVTPANANPSGLNGITANAGTPVPKQLAGNDFIGSFNRYGPGANNPPWDGMPATNAAKRFTFSSNTCGGCHLSETGTAFSMIHANGVLGVAAGMADFLTGNNMPKIDPVNPPLTHSFDVLNRRAVRLDQMAVNACFNLATLRLLQVPSLIREPLRFPHESAFSPPFVH